MIYEANASSSACRPWRVHLVETSTPPKSDTAIVAWGAGDVKEFNLRVVS
jgi:hypothetical protein